MAEDFCGRGNVELSPVSFIKRAAAVRPEAAAVVDDSSTTWTWAQVNDRCERWAGALQALGVGKADRVAILAPNDLPMLESHFAVPGIGAELVALNTRLTDTDYRDMLRRTSSSVVVVDEQFVERMRAVAADVPSVKAVIGTGPGDDGLDAILAASKPVSLRGPDDERAPLAINFTSGTTSGPKGVVYTHRGAYLNSIGQVATLGLDAGSRHLWTLPMFHCNGWCMAWAVTAVGGAHVMAKRFDPQRTLELLADERITHLCGAPVLLSGLVEAAADGEAARVEGDRRRVTFALGGAAPSPTGIDRLARLGIEVVHLYGMTETYGPSLTCLPKESWSGLGSGDLAPLIARQGVRTVTVDDIRVVDSEGSDVPRDGTTAGELIIRSATVMSHYLDDPQSTEEAIRSGWLYTGDGAVIHPDGYVELRDRLKDVIISGGENVSSIEVEQVIGSHPAVLECAVVANEDARWGEVPVAFVVLRSGEALASEELVVWLRQRLAHFKVPREVHFSDLPKTATGKIRKSHLRRLLG